MKAKKVETKVLISLFILAGLIGALSLAIAADNDFSKEIADVQFTIDKSLLSAGHFAVRGGTKMAVWSPETGWVFSELGGGVAIQEIVGSNGNFAVHGGSKMAAWSPQTGWVPSDLGVGLAEMVGLNGNFAVRGGSKMSVWSPRTGWMKASLGDVTTQVVGS